MTVAHGLLTKDSLDAWVIPDDHGDMTTTPRPRRSGLTLSTLRAHLRSTRADRLAHRRLVAELASYRTPAEQADLDAMLDRYSERDTAEVREIVGRIRYQAA